MDQMVVRAGWALQKGPLSVGESFIVNSTCLTVDQSTCESFTERPTAKPTKAPTLAEVEAVEKEDNTMLIVGITVIGVSICGLLCVLWRVTHRMEEVNRRVTKVARASQKLRRKSKRRKKRSKKSKKGGLGLKKPKKKKRKLHTKINVAPAAQS